MKEDIFKEIINAELKNQEEAFFEHKAGDKDKVWAEVEDEIHKKRRIIPLFWYAAASFIIFFFIGFTVYFGIQKKNTQIAYLQKQLQQKEEITIIDTFRITDTIYISEKIPKIKYVRQTIHDTVFKTETAYDTVHITEYVKVTDTVYSDEPEFIAENNIILPDSIDYDYKRKFKKDKQSRLKFRFNLFSNNDDENYTDHKNLLTFNLK